MNPLFKTKNFYSRLLDYFKPTHLLILRFSNWINYIFFAFLLSVNLSAESLENKIEWEEAEGASQYIVQIRKEDKSLLLEEKTPNLYFKTKLKETGLYEYRIGAENKIGNIAWSDWQSLILQKKETAESKILKKKILLEWEENPQAVKYSLEIENASGENIYKKELKSSKTSVDLPEGKYRYRVSAINELGNSSASDWERLEIKKTLIPEKQKSERWSVIRRSAALPGWGQYYRRDAKYRVFSYPAAFSILIPLYYLNYKNNLRAQNKYDSDISLLALSQNSASNSVKAFGALSYLDSVNARSDLDTSYMRGNQLVILIAGIYFLNLLDAAFFYDYSKPISERQTTQLLFQSFKRQTISFQVEAYSEFYIKANF